MGTVGLVPGKYSPVQRAALAGEDAVRRADKPISRWRRRRIELGLSEQDLATLLSIDERTVKAIERGERPRVLQITQKLIHRIEAGEVNVSGSAGRRGLLVGPGVEMLYAAEQAMEVPQGEFTRNVYWHAETPSHVPTLEERIKSEPGLDRDTRNAMLLLLRNAQRR